LSLWVVLPPCRSDSNKRLRQTGNYSWGVEARSPPTYSGGRAGRGSVFRDEDGLGAAILCAAFARLVFRHRAVLAEGGGGQRGRFDALLLQIARDRDRTRRRELPVARIALGQRAHDGFVVGVPLDADGLVVDRLEDFDHLAEDHQALGLDLSLARIEE